MAGVAFAFCSCSASARSCNRNSALACRAAPLVEYTGLPPFHAERLDLPHLFDRVSVYARSPSCATPLPRLRPRSLRVSGPG